MHDQKKRNHRTGNLAAIFFSGGLGWGCLSEIDIERMGSGRTKYVSPSVRFYIRMSVQAKSSYRSGADSICNQ